MIARIIPGNKPLGALTALVLSTVLCACSGDDTSKPDQGGGLDQGTDKLAAKDEGTTDLGGKRDLQAVDQGVPSNSGKICFAKEECATEDECISPPGTFQRMCLAGCSPGKTCPVPDVVKNASVCALQLTVSGVPKYFCLWFCERQGKTYDCPTPDDYACIEPAGIERGTKICVPK